MTTAGSSSAPQNAFSSNLRRGELLFWLFWNLSLIYVGSFHSFPDQFGLLDWFVFGDIPGCSSHPSVSIQQSLLDSGCFFNKPDSAGEPGNESDQG
jgi:hypothetical protein